MTDIVAQRILLQEEEVRVNAAVSEALLKRVGQVTNFISTVQHDTFELKLNGCYRFATANYLDGIHPFIFDSDIVGISISSETSGTIGITEIEIDWLDVSGNVVGSIFSTNPSFDFNSTHNSYMWVNLVTGTDSGAAAGQVLPVFNKTVFDQGNALGIRLNSSMIAGENLNVAIHFRPR